MYYKNRDVKLLLDLLSTNFGVMSPIQILALCDKVFGEKCKPGDLKFSRPQYHERKSEINIANEDGVTEKINKTKVYDIHLKFNDAPAMDQLFKNLKNYNYLYTVEVLPATPTFWVKEIKACIRNK